MGETMPLVLVAGLACSSRIYAPLVPDLWSHGPVMVANHIRDDSMAAIARRILSEAPPRFALAGHSMGGYIAFEIMKQAPERVMRLALLNTHPLPDTPEAAARRRDQIARVRAGGFHAILDELFLKFVHPSRLGDAGLRQLVRDMGDDIGAEAFVRQLQALITRADMRPLLTSIRCPTLVLTSDEDGLVPNEWSAEMAENITGAKLVVVRDCGHLPQVEQTQATLKALLGWLKVELIQ
ncbi:MAG: alpha/beta fold hydrolase [Tardiphaga sp.]